MPDFLIANSAGVKHLTLLLIFIWLATAPLIAQERPVTIFAAASLQGVLGDIAKATGESVVISYGGSGAMARQVAAGAPADLVILANPDWMAWLEGQTPLPLSARATVASNRLVVIGAASAPSFEQAEDLVTRLGDNRLAIGHREAVPAGRYAQEWLRHTGLWDTLSQRLAETDNVRAASALVAQGQSPFAIVYLTEARADPNVAVVWSIDPATHSPILYPAHALTPEGAALLDVLTGEAAQQIWRAYGFAPAPA